MRGSGFHVVMVVATMVACAARAEDRPPAPPPPPPAAAGATPAKATIPAKATLDAINGAALSDRGVKDGIDPAAIRAEVMLDRLHISPGVIDGRDGANLKHALATYARMRGLKATRGLDKTVWDKLIEESPQPVLEAYTTNDGDVSGPFFPDLPKDYAALARMTVLGYRSPSQKLGARFHMGEQLLAALNPASISASSARRSSSPTRPWCPSPRRCITSRSTRRPSR